ncbi:MULTISPECIES: phage protein NinX family protein [Proteus]|uniref:phage protein NinX family protein n=1 Tax=Proteus TaxID=583 RepID=UPI00137832BE|nr:MULTISPECIES: phage protein NinX family protein [Proteus]MDY3694766.1 phage protein NinX family protein [Proteus mirabilis]NBM94204.1 DUF2591 domain-containing protein [Proteus sp. G2662]GLX62264.1 hypothetical protein KMU_03040 [Proteus vulgaris]
MNSYNKYTDLQINELVATRLKKKCLLTEESVLAYMDSGYRTFDPCNNPTDAMPIIIENKIGLSPMYHSNKWTADCLDYDFISVNKNPYRGAMEVFLMMKEAEDNK